jgi:nucleotide-binding universal stress UspA family protein
MKLLIATDLSQGAQALIDAVNERPWPAGSDACVVHVIDLPPYPLGAEMLETLQQASASVLKSISERLSASGLRSRTEVLTGNPRSEILNYAKKSDADLIFVGSHGGSGLTRFVLGSVARAVVHAAPCSVEIVHTSRKRASHGRGGLKILLATDGSECSIAAARSVARQPWPVGSSVKVISAVPPFVPLANVSTPYSFPSQFVLAAETAEKVGWSNALEAISRTHEILSESSALQVEPSGPLNGDPKSVILDEAAEWGADIVVLGSHGRRGFDRLVMGSVSESVALHAHCSVEVIR